MQAYQLAVWFALKQLQCLSRLRRLLLRSTTSKMVILTQYAQLKKTPYSYNANTKSFMRALVESERTAFAEVVGDDKRPDAYVPQVKVMGWDNTANVSIRVRHNQEPAL